MHRTALHGAALFTGASGLHDRIAKIENELEAEELVVGNAGAAEDQLTLTVLDATGQTVVVVTENVQTANCDHVMFVVPKGRVEITPGQTYRLKLSGGTTFGWKYVAGGYQKGAATLNGKPLLPNARSTFLFRTFGPK